VNAPIADDCCERIDGPSAARGHHVEMAVQVNDRSAAAAPGPEDVDARVCGGVLRTPVGLDVLDLIPSPGEAIADDPPACLVRIPWRIHGRQTDERARVLDDLVPRGVDFSEDAFHSQRLNFRRLVAQAFRPAGPPPGSPEGLRYANRA